MRSFWLTPAALADLGDIVSYVAAASGASRAESVRSAVLDGVRRLTVMPRIGHLRSDLTSCRVRFWPVFGYLVTYRVVDSRIEVTRILHGARSPALLDRAIWRCHDVEGKPTGGSDLVEERPARRAAKRVARQFLPSAS